jgi:hypothetical protein
MTTGSERDYLDVLDGSVDLERPSAGRVYDYWLGGAANLAVDRRLGDEMIRIDPRVVTVARANRAFLRRVVRFCVERGIRQFIDLGSGIPTVGNVHEVAQHADPSCRIAYVDIDGIAVAHSRSLLWDNPSATVTQADLRDVDAVLSAPGVVDVIDPGQPVAVLALLVLGYFPDGPSHPAEVLAGYRERLAPGSYFAVSHVSHDGTDMDMAALAEATRRTSTPLHLRTRAEIGALLGDLELVEPGVVAAGGWRQDDPYEDPSATATGIYVAVGRSPVP